MEVLHMMNSIKKSNQNYGRYCIYLRKSRADLEAEQKGEMETLTRHKNALLELASKLKLSIEEIYEEIESGENIYNRPVMQRLLSEVEQGLWDGVLVMEIERLARGNSIDQGIVAQAFKLSNTKIITPFKTYDPGNEFDEEYFEFGLFMSRREYKVINRRLQGGRLASIKEGKYVASRPPYGYVRVKLQKEKGFTLEPNPEQAPIVKMIFELYTKGEKQPDGSYKRLGVNLITRKLNDLGIPSYTGNKWVSSSIRDILINPVYIGKIRWNWRPAKKKVQNGTISKERPRSENVFITDGLHEAIIDEETFNLAQEYLSSNQSRHSARHNKISNPLAGLVKCGLCGRNMVARPYSNGYPTMLICAVPICKNVSSHLYLVEERILQSLEEWLGGYKLDYNNIELESERYDTSATLKEILKNLNSELSETQKQLNSVYDNFERGIYTEEVFLTRNKILNEKICEIKQKIDNVMVEIKHIEERENIKKEYVPQIEKLLDVYYKLETPEEKNTLLKEVIEKVVYLKLEGGRWSGMEDKFELTIIPRLPKMV
jgi:site-specific DNA recombinase